MSLTQFSMVEELAFLVKDNLPCKHLVLSMEDMLVDFLQDETSYNEVLELEPMNPYNRLLLHRLADIFGFSHESIGEGDVRHLVLKRIEDTSIPSILVADMLWEQDDYQSPVTSSQLLSRQEDDGSTILGTKIETFSAPLSLEDREAAYVAARKRIFSTENDDEAKERPRNNPVVARRMIAHALGQRIKQSNQETHVKDKNQAKKSQSSGPSLQTREKSNGQQRVNKTAQSVDVKAIKEEHIGAAKRMFANALRLHPGKDTVFSKCGQTQTDKSNGS